VVGYVAELCGRKETKILIRYDIGIWFKK